MQVKNNPPKATYSTLFKMNPPQENGLQGQRFLKSDYDFQQLT